MFDIEFDLPPEAEMTVTYQPVLVLLSIGVAILGSLTALALNVRLE
jgi:NO-binding membrane sensor protein with MHYT domain